jgi:hypothetical protein
MAQTQLGFRDIVRTQPFKELGSVETKTSDDGLGIVTRSARESEGFLDSVAEGRVEDGEGIFRFFGRGGAFGEIEFKQGMQVVIQDALIVWDSLLSIL